MENLLATEAVNIINNERNPILPQWTRPALVLTEETTSKVFDIVDTRYNPGSIIRPYNSGQSTYYNGGQVITYRLRFIKFEEFLNQFREKSSVKGQPDKDWAKWIKRPDYLCYSVDNKDYFIVHELSVGAISSKRSDARAQLLSCLLFLFKSKTIEAYINCFTNKKCIVSARGCVQASPLGMADAFNEAYANIPDPNPIKCSIFYKKYGFSAIETNTVKL